MRRRPRRGWNTPASCRSTRPGKRDSVCFIFRLLSGDHARSLAASRRTWVPTRVVLSRRLAGMSEAARARPIVSARSAPRRCDAEQRRAGGKRPVPAATGWRARAEGGDGDGPEPVPRFDRLRSSQTHRRRSARSRQGRSAEDRDDPGDLEVLHPPQTDCRSGQVQGRGVGLRPGRDHLRAADQPAADFRLTRGKGEPRRGPLTGSPAAVAAAASPAPRSGDGCPPGCLHKSPQAHYPSAQALADDPQLSSRRRNARSWTGRPPRKGEPASGRGVIPVIAIEDGRTNRRSSEDRRSPPAVVIGLADLRLGHRERHLAEAPVDGMDVANLRKAREAVDRMLTRVRAGSGSLASDLIKIDQQR